MAHVHQPKANPIQASQPPTPQTRLIPVNQWPDHHPWPTVGGLRWMIFKAKTNVTPQPTPSSERHSKFLGFLISVNKGAGDEKTSKSM